MAIKARFRTSSRFPGAPFSCFHFGGFAWEKLSLSKITAAQDRPRPLTHSFDELMGILSHVPTGWEASSCIALGKVPEPSGTEKLPWVT